MTWESSSRKRPELEESQDEPIVPVDGPIGTMLSLRRLEGSRPRVLLIEYSKGIPTSSNGTSAAVRRSSETRRPQSATD